MNQNNNLKLSKLRPLYDWHTHHMRRGGTLFPTYSSLKWFIRQHQNELINAGVLVVGASGRAKLVTPDFGREVYRTFFEPQN